MPRHESVTDEFVAELKARFETEAAGVRDAPNWPEAQRRIPIAKVAKIVGWSPATMVRMADRYGHFSLNELRDAVESINGSLGEIGSPALSSVSHRNGEANTLN